MSNYTIDDVIAKMLRHADTHKTCASGAVCREFAEMLKEAWKRESEKLNSVIQAQRSQFDAEIDRLRREKKQWGEAACHCVSNAFQSGKIAVVHEQPGNAAKLREALLTIRANIYRDECGDLHIAPDIIVEDVIDKALAEPPRNCDVGTAEEQYEKYKELCSRACLSCPVHKEFDFKKALGWSCQLVWAQMPYEEGGAK